MAVDERPTVSLTEARRGHRRVATTAGGTSVTSRFEITPSDGGYGGWRMMHEGVDIAPGIETIDFHFDGNGGRAVIGIGWPQLLAAG